MGKEKEQKKPEDRKGKEQKQAKGGGGGVERSRQENAKLEHLPVCSFSTRRKLFLSS